MMNHFINVKEYGIVNDGKTLNTVLLQKLIDSCSVAGGGTIFFPPGVYLTGTLILKTNVHLKLDNQCVIRGSVNLKDYDNTVSKYIDGCGVERGMALIYAERARNVSISGEGIVDGNGRNDNFSYKKPRPILLRFVECENVHIGNITLKDSSAWVQHYSGCNRLYLDGVKVDSLNYGNNDGINIDGCKCVRVANCEINSEDDALTLKSTSPNKKCEDVVISNCLLHSLHANGIKFGTETIGGFKDICISNCIVSHTGCSGINVSTIDGAELENVIISNIVMRNVVHSIFIRLGERCAHLPPDSVKRKPGKLKNVIISNIFSIEREINKRIDKPMIQSIGGAIGGVIMGIPGHPVENVTLENIHIESLGGGTIEDTEREIPELPRAYSQYTDWKSPFPAFGLYCRHVENIKINNCNFTFAHNDMRSALLFEDVKGISVNELNCSPVEDNAVIDIRNCRDAYFSRISCSGRGDSNILRQKGCENIVLNKQDY